jgi:hypothetical protein
MPCRLHSLDEGQPPPAILFRATENVPQPISQTKRVIDVDIDRHSVLLGWELYPYDFMKFVYDVRGHHFNIFEDGRVSEELRYI